MPPSKMVLQLVFAMEAHFAIGFWANELTRAVVRPHMSISITTAAIGATAARRIRASETSGRNRMG
jgi:hypothetical protein